MKADFIIRAALQSDAVELKNLFQNTVLAINRRDYSQAEVEDWASCGDDLSNIEDMIKTHYFIVAVRFFIYHSPGLFTLYVCSQGFSG